MQDSGSSLRVERYLGDAAHPVLVHTFQPNRLLRSDIRHPGRQFQHLTDSRATPPTSTRKSQVH